MGTTASCNSTQRRPWRSKTTDHTVPELGPPHQSPADTSRIPHGKGDMKYCGLVALCSGVSGGEGALCLLEVCWASSRQGHVFQQATCHNTPDKWGIPRTGPVTTSFQHPPNPKTHDKVKFSAFPVQPLPQNQHTNHRLPPIPVLWQRLLTTPHLSRR